MDGDPVGAERRNLCSSTACGDVATIMGKEHGGRAERVLRALLR